MSTSFPTRLADLALNDHSHNTSVYAHLKSIRKSALSIPNRLQSVLADAKFAKQVSEYYSLPLVANERCGSWYIDPGDKAGSAYFKSTDGHHGQWGFSLRRLNLQLLSILADHGGAVIVDSTRRGKNLPDAFSKTIPIWVAVINRALFPTLASTHGLPTPPAPDELSPSEISQIEARLDGFVEGFIDLGLDLDGLSKELARPIRITWAINGLFEGVAGDCGDDRDSEALSPPTVRCHNVVLCSASRRVRGAEVSEGGYIQGAGDDSEGWSQGLTAPVFWKHRDLLMRSSEEELPALIQDLLERDKSSADPAAEVIQIVPTSNIYVGAQPLLATTTGRFDLVINCNGQPDSAATSSRVLNLKCRPMKLGSKDLREKLAMVSNAVGEQMAKDLQSKILVTCSTGRDLSVGVAVALLCHFYDDEGRLRPTLDIANLKFEKQLVKQRLAWITRSKPDANPSRATLQAVNSFLMHRPD